MNLIKDQQCIQLDMSPLALSIKQHAKQWIECYGSTLRESAKTELLGLDSLFKVSRRSRGRCLMQVCFNSLQSEPIFRQCTPMSENLEDKWIWD